MIEYRDLLKKYISKDKMKRLRREYMQVVKGKRGYFRVEMGEDGHAFLRGIARFTLWSRIKIRLGLFGKLRMKVTNGDE